MSETILLGWMDRPATPALGRMREVLGRHTAVSRQAQGLVHAFQLPGSPFDLPMTRWVDVSPEDREGASPVALRLKGVAGSKFAGLDGVPLALEVALEERIGEGEAAPVRTLAYVGHDLELEDDGERLYGALGTGVAICDVENPRAPSVPASDEQLASVDQTLKWLALELPNGA